MAPTRGLARFNRAAFFQLAQMMIVLFQLVRAHFERRSRILQLLLDDGTSGSVLAAQYQVFLSVAMTWVHRIFRYTEGIFYVRPRSIHWWGHFASEVNGIHPHRYREFFHVNLEQFEHLCSILAPSLTSRPPPKLRNIPTRKVPVGLKVVAALSKIAIGNSYMSVSEQVGLAPATVHKYVKQFSDAVVRHMSHYLNWPEDLSEVKNGFEERRGFPNCCGAMDATHFELDLLANACAINYYDKDKDYSITLQAVVDIRARFLDVFVGTPGSCNDINILRKSSLYNNAIHGMLFNGPRVTRGGFTFPEYIIADARYFDLPWLVLPYPGCHLQDDFKSFNYLLCSSRVCAERTFGIFKTKWRLFYKKLECENVGDLTNVIYACCILHNYLIEVGERENPISAPIVDDDYSEFLRAPAGRRSNAHEAAMQLRNNLKTYLLGA